jgi:hypothetical protein
MTSGAPRRPASRASTASWPPATSALVTLRGNDSSTRKRATICVASAGARSNSLLFSKPCAIPNGGADLLLCEVVFRAQLREGNARGELAQDQRDRNSGPGNHRFAESDLRIGCHARDNLDRHSQRLLRSRPPRPRQDIRRLLAPSPPFPS